MMPTWPCWPKGCWRGVDGDYAGAIAALETALAGKPEFVRARLELARIYFEDHQLNAARDAFERAQGSAGLPPQVLGMIDQYPGRAGPARQLAGQPVAGAGVRH